MIRQYPIRLLGGRSVIFYVTLSWFKKRLNIAVPFSYEWEGIGDPDFSHWAYFIYSDLPEQPINDKERRVISSNMLPNNSFNASANKVAFIRETMLLLRFVAPR
jgi:hypothetical protein